MLKKTCNFNFCFVNKIPYAIIFSLLLTIAVFIGLLQGKLNTGIDFSGGILIELTVKADSLEDNLKNLKNNLTNKYRSFSVNQQILKDGNANIYIKISVSGDRNKSINDLKQIIAQNYNLITATDNTFNANSALLNRIDYVGPKAGKDFFLQAIKAIGAAILGMLIYIWISFEWRFAIGVIIALLHDAVATLGFYMISQYEFDLTAIAVILTIIGYSVNDSVVICDRIRDNLKNNGDQNSIEKVLNNSLNETLWRTIMTGGTTLVVCLALIIYGGSSLKGFSCAMFFGIVFGTYSSIYIAPSVLLSKNKLLQILLSSKKA